MTPCPECDGKGRRWVPMGFNAWSGEFRPCKACGGVGDHYDGAFPQTAEQHWGSGIAGTSPDEAAAMLGIVTEPQ